MLKSERIPTTLVTRFSALGDVAMTLPLLYNVAKSNPSRHFLMLTRPHATGMFVNPPDNLEVRGVDLDSHGSPGDIISLCRSLLEEYYIDSFADLHDVLRTKIMRLYMKMRGVNVRHIDKLRKQRRALTRSNNKHLVPLTPIHVLYGNVFSDLNIRRQQSFVSIFGINGAPVEMLHAIPETQNGKTPGTKWIAIAPFARHTGKVYPEDRMELVIANLASIPGVTVFVLGAGPEETSKIQKWADTRPSVINMAARKVGFKTELALLSHCDALLSMDSANMHLASLVGCPVVSIWGATHPYTGFYGRGQDADNAVQLALPCRPCSIYGNKPCRRGDYLCLAGLTPDVVLTRLKRVCGLSDKNDSKEE